jgi:hypothetical protein
MKKNYRTTADGEVAGRWRPAGSTVSLTPQEARYLAPPLGTILKPEDEGSADGKLDRHKRQRRKPARRLGSRQAVDRDHPDHASRQPGDAP